MAVKIKFDTGNAAFDSDSEISRILEKISHEIESGYLKNSIRDSNGNKVGKYTVD